MRKQFSSFLVSFAAHVAVLVALNFLFTLEPESLEALLAIDSVIAPDDRERIDFEKKLDQQEQAATTFNTVAGQVSAKIGGGQQVMRAQQTFEVDPKLTEINVPVTSADAFAPGVDTLNHDLGPGEVLGSTQQLVRGYGDALDQLTQELLRMMRTDKLLVVWMFDESESMKDDQQEIKKRIGRVFTELKIVDREPDKVGIAKSIRRTSSGSRSLLKDVMVSSIVSYGGTYHPQTKTPTSDLPEIMAAIDRIPIDKTGKENTCASLMEAMTRHRGLALRDKRKLVMIVISDESGDDGLAVDNVVKQSKLFKSPIYVLGRESVFGSLYAHVKWRQPETGRDYFLPIRRGPETPFAELLQHDGFRRRHDSHMSSFGPYDQVRMCRDSGGIFFQLPHEQQDLNDFEELKYAALAMQEYKPDLTSRAQYSLSRDRSPFRKAIWNVIALLNPYDPRNKGLELPDPRYQRFTTTPGDYLPETTRRGRQIVGMLQVYERAIAYLEKVKPLRDSEPSRRWRANYDLILAQLYWYRLRLFEYGIGMDQFVRKGIPERVAKNPKHNRWLIRETSRQLVFPDDVNVKQFNVTSHQLSELHRSALARLEAVRTAHPETPWATRAAWEIRRPFGVTFGTYFQPPPRPGKSKPRPKPTPPPNL